MMKKQEQQPPSNVSPFSIDQWEDVEAVKVPWFDNPLWGALMVGGALLGLSTLSAFSIGDRNRNPSAFHDDGSGGAEWPAGMPAPLTPEQIEHELNQGRSQGSSQGSSPTNSQWSTPPNQTSQSPSTTPADVSTLISELSKSGESGRNRDQIRHELWNSGCDDKEIMRRLAKRLNETTDAKSFEGIVLALASISHVPSSDTEIKNQLISGLAAAGQHLQTPQLGTMDPAVPQFILNLVRLPESVDLLKKVASIDDDWGQRVLTNLSLIRHDNAPEIAVQIARENNIHPRHLRNKDSEVVSQFLWEGKLAGKEDFARVKVGDDDVSIKAFSKVAVSMIDNDPNGAVDSLSSIFWGRHRRITRQSVSEELVQKADPAFAAKVEEYLVAALRAEDKDSAATQVRNRASTFLGLAERLGGRETAIAIAKVGKSNPEIFEKFRSTHGILLSVNEPQTHDAIVEATVLYGANHSAALRENVGAAIEPAFLERIKAEQQKKGRNQTKRVANLIEALGEIGTEKSIPLLEELQKGEKGFIKQQAQKAIQKIGGR